MHYIEIKLNVWHLSINKTLQIKKWYLFSIQFMEVSSVVPRNNPYLKRKSSSKRNQWKEVGRWINQKIFTLNFTNKAFPCLIKMIFHTCKTGRNTRWNNWQGHHLTVRMTHWCTSWSTMVFEHLQKLIKASLRDKTSARRRKTVIYLSQMCKTGPIAIINAIVENDRNVDCNYHLINTVTTVTINVIRSIISDAKQARSHCLLLNFSHYPK